MLMGRRGAMWVDEIAGALARWRHRGSLGHPDTSPDLERYFELSKEELFPEPTGTIEVSARERWQRGGLRCDSVRFESLHTPICPAFSERHADYEENHTAHVRWVRHVSGRRPTIIFLHSWMQPFTRWEDRAMLPNMARRLDVDVARLTLPYHGRRRPISSTFDGEYFWSLDLVRTIEALRQSIADVRSLLSWLEAQAYGPVGVLGISLGGIVTLLTTCVEPRVWCSIPCVAHLDVGGVIEEASLLTEIRSDMERMGWGPAELDGWIRRLGLRDLRPAIDHDRILMVGGEHDRFLQSHRVRDLWEDWGRPEIDWFPGGHLGVFRYLCGDLRAARKFLDGLRGPQPIVEDTPVAPSGAPAPA